MVDKNDARIEARVPQQAYDAVVQVAERYGVPISQVVRWAIWDYVAQETRVMAGTQQEAQR